MSRFLLGVGQCLAMYLFLLLSVHDSMIVRMTETIPLRERMLVALHNEFPECPFESKLVSSDTGEDELRHLEPIERWGQLKYTPETPGYKKRFERFCDWKSCVAGT
jgi:hypothetical protein